jgi:hypothetical protein
METKKVQKNLIPVYSEKKKNTIETDWSVDWIVGAAVDTQSTR